MEIIVCLIVVLFSSILISYLKYSEMKVRKKELLKKSSEIGENVCEIKDLVKLYIYDFYYMECSEAQRKTLWYKLKNRKVRN